ncbi:MAG: UbiX family flavin prenyltransferase [Desulfuromonadales bacterium]|jgi:4-hydroxy-3-polyprenylbenzoate decarboxylase|nr:UbiX family flavin prenyltransferase [Desulfuromonadales bacterium]MDH3808082.1 UbiX family flavin prenyltransferase [Desulfuromonadales bacterium]MDH3869041.1 UbiX family flavin prenyltransferase [Desulfuromonadales bacterium]MDH4024703.1 UbiX family flavin prenyltransferase [Desulfuromonadales bacterium]
MTADNPQIRHFVVAITGASGSVYGLRLISELLRSGERVSLILTSAGRQVMNHETGLEWSAEIKVQRQQVQEYFASIAVDCLAIDDFWAGAASGSAAADAMIVAPCSMGTLGRIAAGLSGNLLERAADVMLKERRRLLLVPRETPFNNIHLENLLRLSQAGAVILPAMPGFYHGPETIEDLVDFVVGKILDQLDVQHSLFTRWGEDCD